MRKRKTNRYTVRLNGAIVCHDGIDTDESYVEFLDVLYTNLKDKQEVEILIHDDNVRTRSLDYLCTKDSMARAEELDTVNRVGFRGPLGERILFRNVRKNQGGLFTNRQKPLSIDL